MDENISFGIMVGCLLGLLIATAMFVTAIESGFGRFHQFDPATDCQEVWDIYADVVGYEIDGIHYPWLGNNHRLWSKLGFTDLEVHEFEYCINHMPWKGGSG